MMATHNRLWRRRGRWAAVALAAWAWGAPAQASAPVPTAPPTPAAMAWSQARIVGRHVLDEVDGQTRLRVGWPATGVGVRFEGPSLTARLEDLSLCAARAQQPPDSPLRGWHSFWSVRIDGAPAGVVRAGCDAAVVQLAADLAPGPHTLWLFKRTEAMLGATWLWDVRAAPGARILPPPPGGRRRIEVLGASNETGYGILGAGGCSGFQPSEQDYALAWPQLLADRLDAELVLTAFSGKGLVRNHPAAGDPALTLPAMWHRADAGQAAPEWDFSATPADAVFIDLGGNDWAGFGGIPDRAQSEDAMVALVHDVRAQHPGAWIFVVLNGGFGPPERGLQEAMLRRAVARAQREGARRARFFAFSRDTTAAGKKACDGHPNAAAHAKMAGQIAPVVARVLSRRQGSGARL